VRVLVWCKACRHEADADLQALVDAGRGDVPLSQLRFRANCGSRLADFMVTATARPWLPRQSPGDVAHPARTVSSDNGGDARHYYSSWRARLWISHSAFPVSSSSDSSRNAARIVGHLPACKLLRQPE
jgi:hypothetical protein